MSTFIKRYLSEKISSQKMAGNLSRLSSVLAKSTIDLNPHQIHAALYAFNSPLSRGAILADEVGLGKTIEAGIILSQKWAEGKRKLLIICPSSLRKQWSQELLDKFYLKSEIVDGSSFKNKEATNYNPFNSNNIVICSYHFARNKEEYIKLISWDLAVLDEAHKLRGVYRNTNIISTSIKKSLENTPKLLLTATPLQNSLLELYGLTSFIDEHIFGDLKSYKSQFCKLSEENVTNFEDLKSRLAPVCKRTLRKQVLEYIKYTNRIPITQDYTPTQEEKELYDKITLYLQKPKLYALPNSQKHLITLILRKLLASSTFAIAGTLKGLISKLNKAIEIGSLNQQKIILKSNFLNSMKFQRN
jgi:SNF2 family DNA or RNA helicase